MASSFFLLASWAAETFWSSMWRRSMVFSLSWMASSLARAAAFSSSISYLVRLLLLVTFILELK